MKNKVLKTALILSLLILTACGDIEVHPPDNAIMGICDSGVYKNSIIRCVNSNGSITTKNNRSIPLNSRALYIFIEPGNYDSNVAVQDEAVRAISTQTDVRIRPHLRQILINLVVGHQKLLMDRFGSKYDVIYFARTDHSWGRDGFLQAMENVIRNHSTVDMMLMVHGNPSALALGQDLQTRVYSSDLDILITRLSLSARNRVHAIFSPACYTGVGTMGHPSIAQKLTEVFPRTAAYGGTGVNFGVIHRDLIGFEFYYQGWDFANSVQIGNSVLTKNIRNFANDRMQLDMPVFSIKGQARYFGFKKTEYRTVRIQPLQLSSAMLEASKAHLFSSNNGAKISDLNIESLPDIAPVSLIDLSKPSAGHSCRRGLCSKTMTR